jgi:hypothetical protein
MEGDSVHANHNESTISAPLDEKSTHLFLNVDNQVIASIRITSGKIAKLPKQVNENYQHDAFSHFYPTTLSLTTYFTAAKKLCQSKVINVLLGAAYKTQSHLDGRFDFTSCPPALVPVLEQIGYRQYGGYFESEDREFQVPLVLLMEDVTHLRECGSPFNKIAREYETNRTSAQWFGQKFPDAIKQGTDRGMDEERFWPLLSEQDTQDAV